MDLQQTAEYINTLGKFLGRRDLDELTQEQMQLHFNIKKADAAVLFGGSIIHGGDVFARAMQNNLAEKYVIVGGAGHTTETLRQKFLSLYPEMDTKGRSEAECFSQYLKLKYNLKADYLETKSTNCGNNITFCLDLLQKNHINPASILFIQDASMQLRMEAGFRKHLPDTVKLISYAAYKVSVVAKNNALTFDKNILGLWDVERYVSLLLGEIPRLSDTADGYGPKGKGFIAHVDIPDSVMNAFCHLQQIYPHLVRTADNRFSRPL